MNLAALRQEYANAKLDIADVDPDPIVQFGVWLEEAQRSDILEPNAMTLATATPAGKPSARVVLLKGVDERGFSFFTNRESRKADELAENQHAALLFYWYAIERQVRVEGVVEALDVQASAAYFAIRPRGSQLGAWASPQSREIASREVLEERLRDAKARFEDGDIPCPPFWGGYVLRPERIEFWQGRPNRLHDRIAYERTEHDAELGAAHGGGRGRWRVFRLAP